MLRPLLASTLVVAAMGGSFLLPKPHYASLNVLRDLQVPTEFAGWTSRDVSQELNLTDDRYNFISDVFARVYRSRRGDELLLLILDAGNFHNPKVCYTSSGFSVRELSPAPFRAGDAAFSAQALQMRRPPHEVLLFYWLCIDRRIVTWARQKVAELWSSLSNTKKAGLMVRLEISGRGVTPAAGHALSQAFLRALADAVGPEQRAYLFGS